MEVDQDRAIECVPNYVYSYHMATCSSFRRSSRRKEQDEGLDEGHQLSFPGAQGNNLLAAHKTKHQALATC